MSITRSYSVFCDGDSRFCHGWIAETTNGAAAARREAKAAGWKKTREGDFCPGCLKADAKS